MNRRFVIFPLLLAAFCLFPAPGRADSVIFSNLGTAGSYSDSQYGVWGNNVPGGTQDAAMPFTVGASSSDLTEIEIALTNGGGTNGATVELLTSAGTTPGSTILGSWTLTDLPTTSASSIQSSQIISGISGIVLTADTTYWLAAIPLASDTVDAWKINNTGDTANYALVLTNDTNWTAESPTYGDGAFEVLGDPTPEPNSLLLLAFGLAALLALASLSPRARPVQPSR